CDIYADQYVPQFIYNYHKPITDFQPVYYTTPNVNPNNCGYPDVPTEAEACPSNFMFGPEKQMKLTGDETDLELLASMNEKIDSLQAFAGSSDSAAIQDQINDLQFQKSMVIQDLLFDISLLGNMDSAANFLLKEGEVKSSIGYFIAASNFAEAEQQLSSLQLNDADDSAFYQLTQLQIDLFQTGNSWFDMNDDQEKLIRTIAFDTSNMSRGAKNILELVYGEYYPEEFPVPFKTQDGRIAQQSIPLMPQFILFPNPATNEFTVQFNTEIQNPADFIIYNLSGQEVYRTKLAEGVTQLIINSSGWEPGFFLCQLKADNRTLFIQKLIITKI
ncbi:MAG: T9SS type A sorting domain-containing protein, partial [Chitinophagales bacterium]|nr:T9SS type A sorting domain-containing protein [Chitinophagales bacterium]